MAAAEQRERKKPVGFRAAASTLCRNILLHLADRVVDSTRGQKRPVSCDSDIEESAAKILRLEPNRTEGTVASTEVSTVREGAVRGKVENVAALHQAGLYYHCGRYTPLVQWARGGG